jgi:hypothetical protein
MQRMRHRRHADRARQYLPEMLQSVACLVVAGKTGLLRGLWSETTGPRQADWHEFNRGLGASVHRGFILGTPMGDFASVYFEAPDPVAANAAFAADTSNFGRYFKATAEEAFGIDLSQPLPSIRQLFEVAG